MPRSPIPPLPNSPAHPGLIHDAAPLSPARPPALSRVRSAVRPEQYLPGRQNDQPPPPSIAGLRRSHGVVFLEGLSPVGFALAQELVAAEIGVVLLSDDAAIGAADTGFGPQFWGRRRSTTAVSLLRDASTTRCVEVPAGSQTAQVDLHVLIGDTAPQQQLRLPDPDQGATAVLPVLLSGDSCVIGPVLGAPASACTRCYRPVQSPVTAADPARMRRVQNLAVAIAAAQICSVIEGQPLSLLAGWSLQFSAVDAELVYLRAGPDPECDCQAYARGAQYRGSIRAS